MQPPAFRYDCPTLQEQKTNDRVCRFRHLRDRGCYIDVNSPRGLVDRHIDLSKNKHGEHPDPTEPAGSAMRQQIEGNEKSESEQQQEPFTWRLVIRLRLEEPEA